jgi:hypothetical protein
MTRKTLLIVVALVAVVGLTFGFATTAFAAPHAADTATYTISASAGPNGTMTPIGDTTVSSGGRVVYTMQPAEGYQVATITVDATQTSKAGFYSFPPVTASHTIAVTFKANPAGWFTVTPYFGDHGQIWMAQQTVQASDTAPAIVACSVTADAGYHVETLLVDGLAVASNTAYTNHTPALWDAVTADLRVGPNLGYANFYNVRAGHRIEATFEADPVAPTDTTAPVSSSDAAATYDVSPATIHLTSGDEAGGSGMAALYYKVDGGATMTVLPAAIHAAAGTPALGLPAAHNPVTPTNCACHASIVPAVHSGGAAPASCGCHALSKPTAAVEMPSTHSGRTGNCTTCHPASGVIMPVSHYGQTAGYPGAGACEACHTFHAAVPTDPNLHATVSVSGDGPHSIEFWGKDVAGNVETPHKTASFTISTAVVPVATSITIKAAASVTTIGKTVTLSGLCTPTPDMVGKNIVVMVKKPGKTYWTYSSNRTVYSASGVAAWLYKYNFKRGLAKGTYQFKAVVEASTEYVRSESTIAKILVR